MLTVPGFGGHHLWLVAEVCRWAASAQKLLCASIRDWLSANWLR